MRKNRLKILLAAGVLLFTVPRGFASPAADGSGPGIPGTGEGAVNPFIGVWQAGDATYEFFADGTFTVISTHCCGLRFQDEYSYFLREDTLFTYGALMGGPPALKQFTFAVQDADAIRVVSSGGTEYQYTRFDEESALEAALKAEEDFFGYGGGHLEENPLLGTWDTPGKGLRSISFRDNGTVVFRPNRGPAVEAGYLVRENGLAVISPRGKGPAVREYTYEAGPGGIALCEKGRDVTAYFLGKEVR